MQFSPLCRSCQARARLRRKEFYDCGGSVNFVQACLNIRKARESSFLHRVCAG